MSRLYAAILAWMLIMVGSPAAACPRDREIVTLGQLDQHSLDVTGAHRLAARSAKAGTIRLLEYWGRCNVLQITLEGSGQGPVRIEAVASLYAVDRFKLSRHRVTSPPAVWSRLAQLVEELKSLPKNPDEGDPSQKAAFFENCYREGADQFLVTIHRVRVEVSTSNGVNIRDRNDCQDSGADPAFRLLDAAADAIMAATPDCGAVNPLQRALDRLGARLTLFGNVAEAAEIRAAIDEAPNPDLGLDFYTPFLSDQVRLDWITHPPVRGKDRASALLAASDCSVDMLATRGQSGGKGLVEGVVACSDANGDETTYADYSQAWAESAGTWKLVSWWTGPPRKLVPSPGSKVGEALPVPAGTWPVLVPGA